MPKHYYLSPSASTRWLECPGSLLHVSDSDKRSSQYADDGTRAHAYAEEWLRSGNEPTPRLEPELRDCVRVYVEYCTSLEPLVPKVEHTCVSPLLPDLGGTIDFVCVNEDDCVELVDLKTGAGVFVPADSTQMGLYALLVKHTSYGNEKVYKTTVVQPRCGDPAIRSKYWTHAELDALYERVLEAITSNAYNPGEHCRWCPHLEKCDAAREAALSAIDEPESYDEWAQLLRHAPVIRKVLDVAGRKVQEGLASGHKLDGVKLVRSIGNTTWKGDSDEEILKQLRKLKIGKRKATVSKLKTPTQLKREGYDVDALTYRPDRGLVAVPETDRRPAENPLEELDSIQ